MAAMRHFVIIKIACEGQYNACLEKARRSPLPGGQVSVISHNSCGPAPLRGESRTPRATMMRSGHAL
jgi:hypothetical protein